MSDQAKKLVIKQREYFLNKHLFSLYMKRDLMSNGSTYVINKYFKELINIDDSKYEGPMGEFYDIAGVFKFSLRTLNFQVSNTTMFVAHICDLMINGEAKIFYEYPFKRVEGSLKENIGGSEGCYIATAVYGSYQHPSVLILRKFRDVYLKKRILGRAFIKIYYYFSPKMTSIFHGKSKINSISKKILNRVVIFLRNKGY